MSGEPYSQKRRWINHSNERFFQVMTSFSCITCYGRGFNPPPVIKYPLKMKSFGLSETKLFHFHGIFKINEINKISKANPTPLYI